MIDLSDSPEQREFRARLRAWLAENLPRGPMPREHAERYRFIIDWHKRLFAGGWIGLSWPAEYGGQGLGPLEEAILSEELGRTDAPPKLNNFLGRPILMFGSEAQRKRYLRPMLSGDEIWCQGFSEPGAGSDLASLRTRAERDPSGGFRISGQKIWTSNAQFADLCYVLARTDPDAPRHKGISAFVVPMHASGIEVRTIDMINGSAHFAEVFFDRTPVPEENLIGELNAGWRYAMLALAYERGPVDIGVVGKAQGALGRLRRRVHGRSVDDGALRALARAEVEVEVLRIHCARSLGRRMGGKAPGPEGSIDKLLLARVEQDLYRVALQLTGAETLLDDGDEWFAQYLYARSASVYGGTAQIQRNIVADRVLRLPG